MADDKQRATEEEWWDTYADVQEQIWVYDEYFETIVRSGYLQEMVNFLYRPSGRVLDFGCGSGWVGLRLAEKGMHLEGVDLSAEQIKQAKQQALERGITNVNFWQSGVKIIEHHLSYDSIIVHSLFHHLNTTDKQILLKGIAAKLVDGGKAYFYEPLAAKHGPDILGRILNKGLLGVFWLMRRIAYWLRLQEPVVQQAIQSGWNMQSPNEAPIDLDEFVAMLPPELKLVKVTCWHMATIAYANLCMGLKPFWRKLARPLIVFFQIADWIALSDHYRSYMRAWPMASIMLIKAGKINNY